MLLMNPDITRKDLVEQLGLAGPTVTWYTNRLRDENLICVQKAGKNARYEINPETRLLLKKYLDFNTENVSIHLMKKIPECS